MGQQISADAFAVRKKKATTRFNLCSGDKCAAVYCRIFSTTRMSLRYLAIRWRWDFSLIEFMVVGFVLCFIVLLFRYTLREREISFSLLTLVWRWAANVYILFFFFFPSLICHILQLKECCDSGMWFHFTAYTYKALLFAEQCCSQCVSGERWSTTTATTTTRASTTTVITTRSTNWNENTFKRLFVLNRNGSKSEVVQLLFDQLSDGRTIYSNDFRYGIV